MPEHVTTELATLSELKRAGYSLYANCNTIGCGRGRLLDMDMVIKRYGEGYVMQNEHRIANAIRCHACGRRGGMITLSSPW